MYRCACVSMCLCVCVWGGGVCVCARAAAHRFPVEQEAQIIRLLTRQLEVELTIPVRWNPQGGTPHTQQEDAEHATRKKRQ